MSAELGPSRRIRQHGSVSTELWPTALYPWLAPVASGGLEEEAWSCMPVALGSMARNVASGGLGNQAGSVLQPQKEVSKQKLGH